MAGREDGFQMIDENAAVAHLAELFALSLGISPERARLIKIAAALHDVGKWGIPEGILSKPGKLTPTEFLVVKSHTKIGAQMLSEMAGELGIIARIVCEFHHEWHNGDGYWGIPTTELPDYIPIISIADVFVACCVKRPYKDSWPPEQVLEHLRSLAGIQFSADIVDAFENLIRHNQSVLDIFTLSKGDVPM